MMIPRLRYLASVKFAGDESCPKESDPDGDSDRGKVSPTATPYVSAPKITMSAVVVFLYIVASFQDLAGWVMRRVLAERRPLIPPDAVFRIVAESHYWESAEVCQLDHGSPPRCWQAKPAYELGVQFSGRLVRGSVASGGRVPIVRLDLRFVPFRNVSTSIVDPGPAR